MHIMRSVARKKSAILLTGHSGLRIVAQISLAESNVVVKSGLKSLTKTAPRSTASVITSQVYDTDHGEYYCFLRSCHLCCKALSPDKDVFMYRGDLGFCSVECRNRQIMLDEVKEREEKIKKTIATSSNIDCRGCETCRLLEDLRQQRRRRLKNYKPFPPTKQNPLLSIFS